MPPQKPQSKWVVIEQGFREDRPIYGPTPDKAAAEKVAQQHAARRVVEQK